VASPVRRFFGRAGGVRVGTGVATVTNAGPRATAGSRLSGFGPGPRLAHFVSGTDEVQNRRKRSEYFASRNERFRFAGHKSLQLLLLLNQ
jgi:hypothetical protein